MPVEFEYKALLKLEAVHENFGNNKCLIKQGYLSKSPTVRIRKVEKEGNLTWFLTLKQKIGKKIIEIENEISTSDGMSLWSKCTNKLKKVRYLYSGWDVDFFYTKNQLYFAMAEIELPFGTRRPKDSEVPEVIRKNIIKKISLTDDRFSNKRLSDPKFARSLYGC